MDFNKIIESFKAAVETEFTKVVDSIGSAFEKLQGISQSVIGNVINELYENEDVSKITQGSLPLNEKIEDNNPKNLEEGDKVKNEDPINEKGERIIDANDLNPIENLEEVDNLKQEEESLFNEKDEFILDVYDLELIENIEQYEKDEKDRENLSKYRFYI